MPAAPPDHPDDDRTLLARHAAGDREAFAVLVSRHRDRLWRVAMRTLGDPEDAADAVQDGLVSAYRAAATFRGDAAVTTWLHRIVVNACIDIARRRVARPTVPLDVDAPTAGAPRDVVPDPRAAEAFGTADTAASVVAALRRIPTDQAAAVVLVDVEGFPVREAAQILDVPEGTVKSRCARGRAALAALLRDVVAGNGFPAPPVQPTGNEREGT